MKKYITISGELSGKTITFAQVVGDAILSDEINFKAQESKNGTITMSLKKSYGEDYEISVILKCEIITNADSSAEVKDKVVPVVKLQPGLYAEDGTITYTWEELKTNLLDISNAVVIIKEDKQDELVGKFVIDEEVTSVGNYAFVWYWSLTSIEMRASFTSIGLDAFSYTDLTSAIFINPNGWQTGSTILSSTDLANTSTAATYLKNTYADYIWTRS